MSKQHKKLRKLLIFEDELEGEPILIDMLKDLEFKDDFDSECDDVIKGFILSGKLESSAEERFELYRISIDEFRAELDDQCRETEIVSRPTDSKVKAWIDRNEEYVKRRKRLVKLKKQVSVLRHYNRAFVMKAELLRTKAANRRLEYNDLGMSVPTVSNHHKDED